MGQSQTCFPIENTRGDWNKCSFRFCSECVDRIAEIIIYIFGTLENCSIESIRKCFIRKQNVSWNIHFWMALVSKFIRPMRSGTITFALKTTRGDKNTFYSNLCNIIVAM